MKTGSFHSFKKVMWQLLLLVIPTCFFMAFFLKRVNSYYAILGNEWLPQTIYFACGCLAGVVVFKYRLRFITISTLLILLFYIIYQCLQRLSVGEFDSFLIAIQFYIFSILFVLGWLAAYGFSRSRPITIVWSALLLLTEIALLSRTSDFTVNHLVSGIVPILVYSFYAIYTAELIRSTNEAETKFTWFLGKRLGLFALVILILLLGILTLFKNDFRAIEKEWGGSQSENKENDGGKGGESMTEKGKQGGVKNKDQTKLTGALNKDKSLVFVARLDNFFENTTIPNPLYFTSHYYTKFDTITQTFEIDENLPNNDLFQPDPSKIPLYHRETDANMIKQSLATKDRRIVTAEVYKVNLAPESYVAPSTAYYCQPISVPDEYKKEYKSAYVAKMWVSELNSAYFIYNPAGNMELEKFQELRFAKLRAVETIQSPDKKFENYYTYMPTNEEYNRISKLAKEVTKDAPTPIDKMIAIRDYFLSKDEFKQPLFQYSDNPGVPGIPSASKLNYFLFENRKGYCAYFAGATLFMLRSLGIPSRLAAGFSATDRSSKNPGWYWFYADQAHAWVQVYFQGYGWIDFDTTVPDMNTQQAPQPDGTPPTEVPTTYLVMDGDVLSVDTIQRRLRIKGNKLMYHDSEFVAKSDVELLGDVSLAKILSDTGQVTLNAVKPGMRVTVVSRAEALKTNFVQPNDDMERILARLKMPVPIDEVKIQVKKEKEKPKENKKKVDKKPIDWLAVLWGIVWSIVGLAVVVLITPRLIWMVFNVQAKKDKTSGYAQHRAILYFMNQMGYAYEKGPQTYARQIDASFKTQLEKFMLLYQKEKYSKQTLSTEEIKTRNGMYTSFLGQVKQSIAFSKRFKQFFFVNRTLQFFIKPK
jgi:protein-glutamine gamma-glutamyltransferase